MVKKAPASQESEAKTKANQAANSGELENLREILFGNQARATEDRLNQLEEDLQAMQRNFSDALRETAASVEKGLATEINNQAAQAKANHEALEESLNQLRAETKRQIEDLRTTISQELEALRDDITSHIRRAQNESRQRDDDLRQELLTVSSWLDGKLTPRQDLGQMLMEVAQRLQSDTPSQTNAPENE